MKRKQKKLAALVTAGIVLILSGCGRQAIDVPELLDSVASTDSFRPVEYGDVGDIDTVCGTIVPTDYCHFFTDNAKVSKIFVDIGDYVNKGDVLAVADTEGIEEEISRISDERHLLDDLQEKEDNLYLLNKTRLGFLLQTAYTVQNMESAKDIQESLDVLAENNRYQMMLHDYRDEQLEKKMNRRRKLLNGSKLIAKESGYVTYVKDLSDSADATKEENIVVVSDFNNCAIEVSSVSFSEEFIHTEKSYRQFFTVIDDVRYELEKVEYTPQELVVIENKQMYPFMKFKAPDGCTLPPAGYSVPVYRSVELLSDVLRIGRDSVLTDEKGTFVYVKKEGDGGKDNKQVRYVTLGKQTEQYAEVISGLKEGELVYYTSGELLPSVYQEITLEGKDFTSQKKANGYALKKKLKSVCYSEYEGKVDTVYKEENDTVEKGDLICTIQTEQAASSLKKMENRIKKLNQDYELNVKELNEQLEEINKQIADVVTRTNLSTSVVSYSQDASADGADAAGQAPFGGDTADGKPVFSAADAHLQIGLELEAERLKCEMEKQKIQLDYDIKNARREYEKAMKDNDGKGLVSIYADTDGMLLSMKAEEGKNIRVKDRLFQITETESDRVLLVSGDVLQIGQHVLLEQKKVDRKYDGKVLAFAQGGRVYVSTQDGMVYLTTNGATGGAPQKGYYYFLSVDDSEFFHEQVGFDLTYDESTMYGVFVVPVGTVRTETVETKSYDYVWRIVDGNMVKQYVTKLDRKGADITTQCIVAGVKSGDVLAVESE